METTRATKPSPLKEFVEPDVFVHEADNSIGNLTVKVITEIKRPIWRGPDMTVGQYVDQTLSELWDDGATIMSLTVNLFQK